MYTCQSHPFCRVYALENVVCLLTCIMYVIKLAHKMEKRRKKDWKSPLYLSSSSICNILKENHDVFLVTMTLEERGFQEPWLRSTNCIAGAPCTWQDIIGPNFKFEFFLHCLIFLLACSGSDYLCYQSCQGCFGEGFGWKWGSWWHFNIPWATRCGWICCGSQPTSHNQDRPFWRQSWKMK